jgi:hypothetical protein
MHYITHRNGIGAADAFQSEVAFNLTFDGTSVVGPDGVPRACVLYYETFQE